MRRVHNFNAGPAALPLPALEEARRELLDFGGTGMSILEHSHRGKDYEAVHDEAIALIRSLLGVTDTHEVLLLQGGASQQFALVPMNLLPPGRSADYVVTGGWAEKALGEAEILGQARAAWKETDPAGRYFRVPRRGELRIDPNAAYVHITSNNTLYGTQWPEFPDTGGVPLVADMSSDFMWRPLDVTAFGLVYAGAQKNVGPSGIAVVLVRKDLLASSRQDIPRIFRYKTHADARSLYNTPPTFSIYLMRNVLRWIQGQGGLPAIEEANRAKGAALYGVLDAHSTFFEAPAEKASRSLMNVVFRLPSEELEGRFLAEARSNGMVGLKGHRSVGGIRASIYNAVSRESVQALASFMADFARANG
jgi:phosphoserine aminotransferase